MTTRICPHCQGHFDVANWICPHCGAEFKRPQPARPGWVQRLAPSFGSLTKGIILVTAIAFVLQLALAGKSGKDGYLVIRMGALFAPLVDQGQLWRLVTPMLLHGDFFHILLNMFALYQLGPLVEQAFGRTRFLVLYVVAGIAGSLGSYLLNRGAFSVGASGAICGFLGVMAVWGFRRGGALGEIVRRQMIMWAVIILVWGLLNDKVDNAGHAGGFVGGVALGYLIGPKGFQQETARRRTLWNLATAATLVVVAACVVASGIYYWQAAPIHARRGELLGTTLQIGLAESEVVRTDRFVRDTRLTSPEAARQVQSDLARIDGVLRNSVPRLGGAPDGAVTGMADAVRLQGRRIAARAAGQPLPQGDPVAQANAARARWVSWLNWFALP